MKSHSGETIGYINAGGRGTRLSQLFTPDPETGVAKALLALGRPEVKLVDHHIAALQERGIETIVVAAGDQSEVYEYISDTYVQTPGVSATRSISQLGTGGDLVSYARDSHAEGSIVVQNVDTILDIDLHQFVDDFKHAKILGGVACISLTRNDGVPNENAFSVEKNTRVVHSEEFDITSSSTFNRSEVKYRASSTGTVIIDADFLRRQAWTPTDGQLSIYKHILRAAWLGEGLYAHDNGNKFFRDVGTVETWLASQEDPALQNLLCYNSTHDDEEVA